MRLGTITETNALRDLGVFVDMKLNFRTHIAKIVSKAHQRCNILLRCSTHTSVSLLLSLVYDRSILKNGTHVNQEGFDNVNTWTRLQSSSASSL